MEEYAHARAWITLSFTAQPPLLRAGDATAGLKSLVKEHSAWLASNCQRQLENYRWVLCYGVRLRCIAVLPRS